MVLLEFLQQHVLRVLVRYVADHDGRPPVGLDPLHVDHIGPRFLITDGPSIADRRTLDEVVVSVRHHLDHHGHAGGGVAGVDVALLEFGRTLSSVAGSDGVGTVLGLLSYHPHAGVDNRTHHLVLLLTLRRLTPLGFVR